jgi:quercetin dioxygenase-like cupin family protein
MTDTILAAEAWPEAIRAELDAGARNPRVGTRLLSETDRVRVWEIRLAPGERIGFHRHVLDYFWTAVTPGRAISRQGDGTVVQATYAAGQTQHSRYAADAFKVHDLENVGDTELVFTTVEFLDSANPPLPLPAGEGGA